MRKSRIQDHRKTKRDSHPNTAKSRTKIQHSQMKKTS
jgi:hypothetical protein